MTRYGSRPASSTAWMVTTWSWLTAAAAWASRVNRWRAVALVASCGAITLIATTRCSFSSNALQHDAHAAAADDLLHLVVAQPAERPGLVGRGEEVEPARRRPAPTARSGCRPPPVGGELLGQPLRGGLAQEARPPARGTGAGLLDPRPQGRVAGAGRVQVRRPLGRRRPGPGRRGRWSRSVMAAALQGRGVRPPTTTVRRSAAGITPRFSNAGMSAAPGSRLAGDRLVEPGPGVGPVPVGRAGGDAEGPRPPRGRAGRRRTGA